LLAKEAVPKTAAPAAKAIVDLSIVDAERMEGVKGVFLVFCEGKRRDECTVDELLQQVNSRGGFAGNPMPPFELEPILRELEEENVIMWREDTIYLI
jgi:hypothetical protein